MALYLWLPLPLLVLSLFGLIFLPSVRKPGGQPFDWAGYILIAVTLFCMTVLTDGPQGLDIRLYLGAHLLGTATVSVIKSQRRSGSTLIDISLFQNKHFVIVLSTFFSGIGNFTTTYSFPVFTQLVQGLHHAGFLPRDVVGGMYGAVYRASSR